MRLKLIRGPAQNGVVAMRLARDKRVRRLGPVAKEVGAGVAQDIGAGLSHRVRDAVDRGVHEPRQRHVRRIDRLALPFPFGRHASHERPARVGERIAAWRARPAAIEAQHEAAVLFCHFGGLVEAPDRLRPHVRLRRAHRVLAALGRALARG